jgi:3-hydroxyacyl-CoA dehydrogenase
LVDEGVASFEDVDRAWMIAAGTPAGPFGLMDMVGRESRVASIVAALSYRLIRLPSGAN